MKRPKTGDTLLVHSKKTVSKIIQFFEKIENSESGYYNHSGKFIKIADVMYILEADYLNKGKKKSKLVASVKLTPYSEYLEKLERGDVELMLLSLDSNVSLDYNKFVEIALRLEGTIYDYVNLIKQIPFIIKKRWFSLLGKNYKPKTPKNAKNAFICHELTQRIDNLMFGWFPNWGTNNVTEIYFNKNYSHYKL